jgi:hypothetical protein
MSDKHIDQEHSVEGAYNWYTWDSPVGLGLFFVCLAVVAVLIRYAIVLG